METDNKEFATIDAYIESFPEEVQSRLHALRQTIQEVAPNAEETIKYRMPTFMLHGNLVYFAAFKNHIGFYPTPSALEESTPELLPYKAGKGTLQFPLDQPLPLALVRKIVEFRVQENLARSAAKKTRSKPKNSQST